MKKIKRSYIDSKIPASFLLDDVGITQSALLKFFKCRKMFLFFTNKIHKIQASQTPFFGTFGHDMLESYYKTKKYNIQEYKNSQYNIDQKELHFMKAKMEILLKYYFLVYKKDRVLQVESQHRYKNYRIKIDGIMQIFNFNYLIDHKFMAQRNEELISKKLKFDFQMLYYVYVYEMVTGKKLTGVIYNTIRNPNLRLGKSESLLQYKKRLSIAIEKDPEHYYKRLKYHFTLQDRKTFVKELNYKMEVLQEFLSNPVIFKNENSCFSRFGSCEYFDLCSSNQNLGYYKRKELYVELES